MPEVSLLACLLRGGAVIPPGLLFALGLLSTERWGQIFPKWPPPEEGTAAEYSRELCFQCPFLTTSHISPLFSQDVLQELQSGLTQIPMETLLCPGSAHESPCVPCKNGVSISPSPMELLRTSPTGLQCQMLQGLFLPVPDSHT